MTEDTDQSGFHVSGWKSLMDKLSRPTSWVSPSQEAAAAPAGRRLARTKLATERDGWGRDGGVPELRVGLEAAVGRDHVDRRGLERILARESELAVVHAALER